MSDNITIIQEKDLDSKSFNVGTDKISVNVSGKFNNKLQVTDRGLYVRDGNFQSVSIYLSSSGSDDNSGSRLSPMATLKGAFNKYPKGTFFYIYLHEGDTFIWGTDINLSNKMYSIDVYGDEFDKIRVLSSSTREYDLLYCDEIKRPIIKVVYVGSYNLGGGFDTYLGFVYNIDRLDYSFSRVVFDISDADLHHMSSTVYPSVFDVNNYYKIYISFTSCLIRLNPTVYLFFTNNEYIHSLYLNNCNLDDESKTRKTLAFVQYFSTLYLHTSDGGKTKQPIGSTGYHTFASYEADKWIDLVSKAGSNQNDRLSSSTLIENK